MSTSTRLAGPLQRSATGSESISRVRASGRTTSRSTTRSIAPPSSTSGLSSRSHTLPFTRTLTNPWRASFSNSFFGCIVSLSGSGAIIMIFVPSGSARISSAISGVV